MILSLRTDKMTISPNKQEFYVIIEPDKMATMLEKSFT